MTKKRGQRPPLSRNKAGVSSVVHLLEQGTLESIRQAKETTRKLADYNWTLYSELALQRSHIESDLTQALNEATVRNFIFKKWQRAVRYRYSLHPLSILGSLKDPGGRFNVADIDPARFPQFPGLYLAFDKETALQETLGQVPSREGSELTAQEIALTNPQSQTLVSVSGALESVIDLREPKRLKVFIELMKDFKLSSDLKKMAKAIKVPEPTIVQTPTQLVDSLLEPDWRKYPMESDVPANSQIFGHLVFLAGIEGIIYPSKLTKKDCLVSFPKNFEGTSSFVEIDDDPPDIRVPRRLDAETWKISEMSFEETIKGS
jgi:hypothetical protein